jgi:hypothetical protein
MFELETDRKDDPLSYIKPKELQKAVHKIHEKKFDNNSVTLEELQIGARLAKCQFSTAFLPTIVNIIQ